MEDLHLVVLEELLELPLSGRISEIPNVQPTSLISTGGSSIGGLRRSGRSSAVGSSLSGGGGGSGLVVGVVFDGSRHLDG